MAHELDRLFLYARDRCDGRETVQEIGDFIAHHNERSKGPLTRCARDFFTVTRVKVLHLNHGFNLSDLPPNFPDFVYAMDRLLDKNIIKKDTGLSRKAFSRKIKPILEKFKINNASGRMYLDLQLTDEEQSIINCILSYIISKPVFTSTRLLEDFIAVLKSNGLLKNSEKQVFKQLAPGIILHALACMHQCEIVLSDGSKSKLSISVSQDLQTLEVIATAAAETVGRGPVHIAFPIFMTELPILTSVSSNLQNETMPWNFPVQLSSNCMRLEKL